ncbi:MAG: hypothetical protein IKD37_07205 [Clostridia bacterium]|nr:hypothetical protein [Clostridia bacterium]
MNMKQYTALLSAVIALTAALTLGGCRQEHPATDPTDGAAVTAAPDSTPAQTAPSTAGLVQTSDAPETTAAPVSTDVQIDTVADGFAVRTVGLPAETGRLLVCPYETNLLFCIEMEGKMQFSLFDPLRAEFIASCTVSSGGRLPHLHYREHDVVLFRSSLDEKNQTLICEEAFAVRYADGRLTAEPIEHTIYPQAATCIQSPDGQYQVLEVIDDNAGRGGLDLRWPDGRVQRLMSEYAYGDVRPDGRTQDYFGSIGFTPVAFLDNTHFLYARHGYETSAGFAIFDIVTGENRAFAAQSDYLCLGTDGKAIYAAEPKPDTQYAYSAYWKITADGEATCLYTIDDTKPELNCLGSCWISTERAKDGTDVTVYSADLDRTIATVSLSAAETLNHYLGIQYGESFAYATDNTLFLFAPGLADTATAGDPLPEVPPQTEMTVIDNPGGLAITTVTLPADADHWESYTFDDRYLLYRTYDRTADGGFANQVLYLLDTETASFVGRCALESKANLSQIAYTDEGLVLYHAEPDTSGKQVVLDAVAVRFTDRRLTAEAVADYAIYPERGQPIVSPDGSVQAYHVQETASSGALVLRTVAGETVLFDDTPFVILPTGASLSDVTYYSPVAFLDNNRLLYRVGGYEGVKGYGIYNIAAKTSAMLPQLGAWSAPEDAYQIVAVRGEPIYVWRSEGNLLWRYTPAGKAEQIGSFTHSLLNRFGDDLLVFTEGLANGATVTAAVTTPALERLATVRVPVSRRQGWPGAAQVICRGDMLLFVEIDPDAAEPEIVALPSAPAAEALTVKHLAPGFKLRTLAVPELGSLERIIPLDDTHQLFWSRFGRLNRLEVLDTATGEFVAEKRIFTDKAYPFGYELGADGVTLLAVDSEASTVSLGAAYAVTYADGVLSAKPVERELYPRVGERILSPNGKYLVVQTIENGTGTGGIDLMLPDGSVKRLLTDVADDGSGRVGPWDQIRYIPVGFLDNTHLLYNMSGYESSRGFGVIDVENGRTVDFPDCAGWTALGCVDGSIYAVEWGKPAYSTAGFWRVTLDGNKTALRTFSADEQKVHELTLNYRFCAPYWVMIERLGSEQYAPARLTVWSLNFTEKLAEAEMPATVYFNSMWFAANGCVFFATPNVVEITETGAPAPETTTPAPETTAPAPETTAPAPETTVPAPETTAPAEPMQVVSSKHGFEVRAVTLPGGSTSYITFDLSSRFVLFLTYDMMGEIECRNQHLYLFDRAVGDFVADCPLAGDRLYDGLTVMNGQTVLYARAGEMQNLYVPIAAVTLNYGPGQLSALPRLADVYTTRCEVTSPDGRYTVRQTLLGDVELVLSLGQTRTLLKPVRAGDRRFDGSFAEEADFVQYSPLAFLDSTRLVYNINGVGGQNGFAVIDVESGEVFAFPECSGYTARAVHDGMIYATEQRDAAVHVWTVSLRSGPQEVADLGLTADRSLGYTFADGMWVMAYRDDRAPETAVLTVWLPGFSEVAAELTLDRGIYDDAFFCAAEDTLYIISPDLAVHVPPVEMAAHRFDFRYTEMDGEWYDDRSFTLDLSVPTGWTRKYGGFDQDARRRVVLHQTLLFGDTAESFRAELSDSNAKQIANFDLEHPVIGQTASGIPYVGYCWADVAEGLRKHWYLIQFDLGGGYSYRFGINLYPDLDGPSCVENLLEPLLASVKITLGEPVHRFGTLIFTHQIFTSPTILRFYIDEEDPGYFSVRYYHASSGEDRALALTMPDGVTYDRVRPIYAGSAGGSGECQFIVACYRGDAVTYVGFDNSAHTDGSNQMEFRGYVMDAHLVDSMRIAMPELFH